jgi:hypothetical protein
MYKHFSKKVVALNTVSLIEREILGRLPGQPFDEENVYGPLAEWIVGMFCANSDMSRHYARVINAFERLIDNHELEIEDFVKIIYAVVDHRATSHTAVGYFIVQLEFFQETSFNSVLELISKDLASEDQEVVERSFCTLLYLKQDDVFVFDILQLADRLGFQLYKKKFFCID